MHNDDTPKEGLHVRARKLDLAPTTTDDTRKEGTHVREGELDLITTTTDDTREEGTHVRARKLDLVTAHTDDTREEGTDVREGNLDLSPTQSDVTTRGAAAVTMVRRLLEPLRRRPVRRLLAGSLVSKTGDWLTVGALMGWVYQETASTTSVALLMLVRLAPPILGGGAAAALVDRMRRERVLVVVELLRAVALATVLTGLLTHLTVLVYVAIGVSGLLAAISQVAVSSLVPRLVPAEQLPAANGLNGMIESSAMATGAIAGGLLLALVGVLPALVADLSTFLVAAALFAGIRPAALRDTAAAADAVADDAPKARLRDLLADRTIMRAVGALCVTVVAGGLVNATLPRFLTELGLGAGGYGYGFGAIAIGLAIGGGAAGAIRLEHTGTALMGRALFATAATFCALAVVSNAPLALLLLVLVGVLDGILWVVFETAMQRAADPRLLGRAFGLTDAAVRTAMIGSIALAPLANAIATPQAILLVGAVVLTIAGRLAYSGRRTAYTAVTGWRATAQN